MVDAWMAVVAICGGLGAIGGAIVYINKAIKFIQQPQKANEERFAKIEEYLANDKRKLEKHDEMLEQVKDVFNLSLKNDLVMLRHASTNNNTGEINETIKNLETWLIDRKF